MLALSTAWNYHEDGDVRQMLCEIQETGIQNLELGYRLTRVQLEGIISLLKEFRLQVVSVHNFCPVPDDGPSPRHISNYYRLSSLDKSERQRAIQWTCHSIETACRVGARVVVIHAGTVELEADPSAKLFQLYQQGKKDSKEFHQLREQLRASRREKREPYIKVLVESLSEVMRYAKKKKINIGLETRYYPVEIPNCEEVGFFLDLFQNIGMFYWHDVGHAEVNQRLGLCPANGYLQQYKERLMGWHIHGVQGLKDHGAPFAGDFDLTTVMPFMKAGHIKVIESHGETSVAQIREAVKNLS